MLFLGTINSSYLRADWEGIDIFIWMCAGDVREFNVLPVHDVNEEEEIEAVQLKIAQEAPVGRQLTAEQSSRIDDTIDKVLRESVHTLEPGGPFETELACEQLSPLDCNGESYYNGVDDTVCFNFIMGDSHHPCFFAQVLLQEFVQKQMACHLGVYGPTLYRSGS